MGNDKQLISEEWAERQTKISSNQCAYDKRDGNLKRRENRVGNHAFVRINLILYVLTHIFMWNSEAATRDVLKEKVFLEIS